MRDFLLGNLAVRQHAFILERVVLGIGEIACSEVEEALSDVGVSAINKTFGNGELTIISEVVFKPSLQL